MTSKYISFLAWMWVICTFFCLVIEGNFYGTEDMNTLNYLVGYNTLELGGLWGVPRLIIGFFTNGFPRLLMWDYSFLEGGFAMIRFIMIAVFSTGAIWGLVSIFVPILQRNL